MSQPLIRCPWSEKYDEPYRHYHDTEWGVPLHDDRALFEFLTLEGAQAGLTWYAVLSRRQGYRDAFHNFDIARVAAMTDDELAHVLANGAIIRNRLKVAATRDNARAALAVIQETGSLDQYLWSFVAHRPIVNAWATSSQVPGHDARSDAMSKALKKRGFRFVGSTICYAFMQASGMVNDHLTTCFRFPETTTHAQ
jgi:DNA-3-methyladenine glycosylase I